MNMMKFSHLRSVFAQERNLPWFCALVAALVAAWVNYQARGVINNDGILYVEVARLFAAGAWQEGVATYNWPFYPLLIMLIHNMSGLEYQVSAHLVSVLFFAATGMGVAVLIRDLGGSRRTMIAALILLIATPYIAGDIVPMVVREHGYWAFHVWSLIFFLRFLKDRSLIHAVGWGSLAIFCVLFRIEGLTYLLGVPLILLAETSRPLAMRFSHFLKANGVVLALGIGLLVLLMMNPALSLRDMGRLHEPLLIAELVYQQLTSGLSMRAETIAQHVLGSYLDDYAMPMLLSGLFYILLAKALTVGGVLQTGFALVYWKKIRAIMPRPYLHFLGWLILLTMINATVILLKGFILPKRILSPMAFVIIILAAFSLSMVWADIQNKPSGWKPWQLGMLIIAGVILVVQLSTVLLPSTPQKQYERDAVEWVLSETSRHERIYFQTKRLRFYAGQPLSRGEDWLTIQESRWRNALQGKRGDQESSVQALDRELINAYDYFVFNLKKSSGQEAVLEAALGQPLKKFEGPRGKHVLVYHRSQAD